MKLHFIAIGGAIMHNLAIVLRRQGHTVTGSDDKIFEPSFSRLKAEGLLPEKEGWDALRITPDIDKVILGMHAREDNPELLKAQKLDVPVYSFPEFMYQQTRGKKRVVIAGSHGKTTITALIMHVLKHQGLAFDYLAGAQIEGFDTMVGLDPKASIAVFEGDEYLSSTLDERPKFLHYQGKIVLISGIAWDHANVFTTPDQYHLQFVRLLHSLPDQSRVIYYGNDATLTDILDEQNPLANYQAYFTHKHTLRDGQTYLQYRNKEIPVALFGKHNMQNIAGALQVCRALGIRDEAFYAAIQSFQGASRRLEQISNVAQAAVFWDFAHAPSKVQASVEAVAEQYPQRKTLACLELHTYSSLKNDFLPQYKGTLNAADEVFIYFNPETLKLKRLPNLSEKFLHGVFGENAKIFKDAGKLQKALKQAMQPQTNALLMSSGDFSGMDVQAFAKELLAKTLEQDKKA